MPTLTLNGCRYFYQIQGSGRPLLLLHGFTGSSQNWATQIENLQSNYQLIAPDLLGHGRSDAPLDPARYRIEAAAADLAALIDKLNVKQMSVLGYSMGGRLALYFALHYPHLVGSLILESASPGLATAEERAARRQQDYALADRIEREGVEAFVEFWERLSLWESQEQLSAESRAKLRALRLQNSPRALANSLRGMGTGSQPSLWPQLSQLDLSVHLIVGTLDAKFVRINQNMAAELPHVHLYCIGGAGHTAHLEQPQQYSKLVANILDGG